MSILSRFIRIAISTLFFVAFFHTRLYSQDVTNAQLTGTVFDQSGAVIPNATVTITDSSRGTSRSAVTDVGGTYQILLIPPGKYTVTTEFAGFARFVSKDVVLTVGERETLPITLSISNSERIIVVSGANLIDTQGSSQSSTVDQQRVDTLPTNGRDYINFALTNSQITRDAAPTVGPIPTSGLNFGGINARSNSINIDGVSAEDEVSGGTRSTVSQDAVQEFQIVTNGFSTEYGRASGGVANIVTKSGTNVTHGSAFGFFRNRYLQATNPFSTVDQPAYTRVQAGFTLGGALIPNRTFYFLSTEITRRQETGFSDIGIDNFGLTNIDVSKFYGAPAGSLIVKGTPEQKSFIASSGMNSPGIQQYIALMGSGSSLALTGKNPGFLQPSLGLDNFATSGQALPASYVSLNSLIGNFPVSEKTEIYSLRFDHKINTNHQLMLRGSFSPSFTSGLEDSSSNQNVGENSFSRTAMQHLHDLSIVGQYTALLGNNKVNELRYQFSRHPLDYLPSLGPGSNNPGVNILGFAFFGRTPYAAVNVIETQNELQDSFTYTRGKHTVKTGINLRYVKINFKQEDLYTGGNYTFAALDASSLSSQFAGMPGFSASEAYGLGIPQSLVQGIGDARIKYDLKILGAYLQDSWRVNPRVTLNYGVRYDVEAVPTPNPPNTLTAEALHAFGIQQGIPLRPNNYAPRVGVAWNIRGEGKTVLRTNYGIFYDRAPGLSEINSVNYNAFTNPIAILAGGSPCTASTKASPLNLNATNAFQGSLSNPNCISGANLGYLPDQQRFSANDPNSVLGCIDIFTFPLSSDLFQ